MSHSSRIPIFIVATLLLLASCGKQQEAQRLVKDYVKTNAIEEVDISSFSKLDSTRAISDSLLQALRRQATADPMFKEGTPLTTERQGPTLYFIRMRYRKDTLEASKTFYFNPNIDGIIAFK